MRKKTAGMLILLMSALITAGGCGQGKENEQMEGLNIDTQNPQAGSQETDEKERKIISVETEILELEEGLSAVQFDGDYGLDTFLAQGGAKTDGDVASFLTRQILKGTSRIGFDGQTFGCSTLSVPNKNGGYLFGRNFDWNMCEAMIVSSRPETGYASVSTVNMNFIQSGGVNITAFPDEVAAMIALYAPLDGMNDQGFAVSVNMIEDSAKIEQNSDKPDITTTTAIRLLLNQAATVDEAIEILSTYDLHSSMGMMIHFSMADANGNSVVVEYIDNQMVITDTPIVTNFYLAEGSKYGIGSSQSHIRYDILDQKLKENASMNETQAKEAMDSVSKDDFNEFESTEWTIIMNQETKELTYYHRENYETGYTVAVE